mgnify:CR=1 FL=1
MTHMARERLVHAQNERCLAHQVFNASSYTRDMILQTRTGGANGGHNGAATVVVLTRLDSVAQRFGSGHRGGTRRDPFACARS